MAYVEISELSDFILEVCHGFFNYCTKSVSEFDVNAPLLDDLNIKHVLESVRPLTDSEIQKIIQIMTQAYPVERDGFIYSNLCFLRILERILKLKEEFNEISEKEIKSIYKNLLHDYAAMKVDLLFSKKLMSRIRGIRAIEKRYSNGLYKKQEFIFNFMLDKAKEHGKWKNLNVAIESTLPELVEKLKLFDKEWISIQLVEKSNQLESIQLEFDEYKKNPPRYEPGVIRTNTRHQTYRNRIVELKVRCRELNEALKMDDHSLVLKNELAFNTDYQPEIIKNLIRKQPNILREIIEDY